MDKLNVLINAYAVSPIMGSEPGMGWNWIVNLANYCNVFVITEGEWHKEIEEAVAKLPQRYNIHFYYNPLPEKVRVMCRNQGDWRFYKYYRQWQEKTLDIAKEIIANNKIDIIHQLNMIGFREPGYLWKIKDIPFVWGPIGGMELMPMSYLEGAPFKQRFFNSLKNRINKFQYSYSPRVRSAINQSSALISAVKGVQDVLSDIYHKDSTLINETGFEIDSELIKKNRDNEEKLKLIWVGKFDFRKQLPLAIRAVAATNNPNIELHICGAGSEKVVEEMHEIANKAGVANQCYWYGNVPHDKIASLMSESDLLFFTSIMEATSTVVLEAISVGLPVLCFNTCGFGPIVKDFAGITIEISNPDKSIQEFAYELSRVYENRHILNDISQKINYERTSLTWDSKAILTTSIYHKILKNRMNTYKT